MRAGRPLPLSFLPVLRRSCPLTTKQVLLLPRAGDYVHAGALLQMGSLSRHLTPAGRGRGSGPQACFPLPAVTGSHRQCMRLSFCLCLSEGLGQELASLGLDALPEPLGSVGSSPHMACRASTLVSISCPALAGPLGGPSSLLSPRVPQIRHPAHAALKAPQSGHAVGRRRKWAPGPTGSQHPARPRHCTASPAPSCRAMLCCRGPPDPGRLDSWSPGSSLA